jgi:DNA-binding NtrC family response regulator
MTNKRKARVLAIDDEATMLEWLKTILENDGYEVRAAMNATRGEELFRAWKPDAVVTDLMLPDLDGVELLKRFKAAHADTEVIVLTGHGSVPKAVEAIRAGAYSFVEKPTEPDTLLAMLEKAVERRELRSENQQLKQQLSGPFKIASIIGKSREMHSLLDMVTNVAPSDANCLIIGENGTGKELIANALHSLSKRAKGPFIKVNCAAIPKDLIESELFGYKKGSFTGALSDKEGLFEMAEGGSLLLDEIGEMPPYLQTKLLRVLQEREFRLNTITFKVPPLRERTEDIPLLCEYFLEKFRTQYQRNVRGIAATAYHVLNRHRWPGNVRELENVIERGVLVAKGNEITVEDLPDSVRQDAPATAEFALPPHRTLAEIEKMAIVQTLQRTGWNKQEAAQILGLYRPTLYSKMKKHAIEDMSRAAGRARRPRPNPDQAEAQS